MYFLDHTFDSPEENLACDEALLELCDDNLNQEVLRFWEPRSPFVVAGYSNKIEAEVCINECLKQNIPILRRTSGGGTVLQGPGCLNYSLIFRISGRKEFKTITSATRYIMEAHAAALGPGIQVQGISDLTLDGHKFSGNAQRRKRHAFLFHGTFLLNFNLSLIETTLAMPSKKPAYRMERSHSDFLVNLKWPVSSVKDKLCKTWGIPKNPLHSELPHEKIRALVREKYACREWNFKF